MSDYDCGAVTAPWLLELTPFTQIGMNKLSGNFSLAMAKNETSHAGKRTYLIQFSHADELRKRSTDHRLGCWPLFHSPIRFPSVTAQKISLFCC